ncbi:hypothetical protein NDU88_004992 [Pleurodeles waltl]|uniref:Uncharacterized protein n=1 Tax=Pleurodeles waltl TaxID=8319 RepID=A0AAV7TTI4_PLEWA|nr:hypothetical protein NDU88_004992 [Pleurodeles waltl]
MKGEGPLQNEEKGQRAPERRSELMHEHPAEHEPEIAVVEREALEVDIGAGEYSLPLRILINHKRGVPYSSMADSEKRRMAPLPRDEVKAWPSMASLTALVNNKITAPKRTSMALAVQLARGYCAPGN